MIIAASHAYAPPDAATTSPGSTPLYHLYFVVLYFVVLGRGQP
jgi:hypothetical protein